MPYCRKCKEKVGEAQKVCPNCGEKLRQKKPRKLQKTRLEAKPRSKVTDDYDYEHDYYRDRSEYPRQRKQYPHYPPPPPLSSRSRRPPWRPPDRSAHTQYQESNTGGWEEERHDPTPYYPDQKAKTSFNNGTWLAIGAIIIIFIAVFLPWYSVIINIETGVYDTQGDFELIVINGWEGFQLNQPPENGEEQNEVFSFSKFTGGIPVLGLIFIIPLIIGLIRIYFAKRAKKRCFIFIKTGIMCLIPIIIILIIISQLSNIGASYNASGAVQDVLDSMSASPFYGSHNIIVNDWGGSRLAWGVQIGGWLLVISVVLMIIGGIMDYKIGKEIDAQFDRNTPERNNYAYYRS